MEATPFMKLVIRISNIHTFHRLNLRLAMQKPDFIEQFVRFLSTSLANYFVFVFPLLYGVMSDPECSRLPHFLNSIFRPARRLCVCARAVVAVKVVSVRRPGVMAVNPDKSP